MNEIEILILAIIMTIPVLLAIYVIFKETQPASDGVNWQAVVIFQLTALWSIIPLMQVLPEFNSQIKNMAKKSNDKFNEEMEEISLWSASRYI